MKLLPLSFGFGFVVFFETWSPLQPSLAWNFRQFFLFISGVWGCGHEAPQLASNHILKSSLLFSYRLIERISAWPLLPPVELPVSPSKF